MKISVIAITLLLLQASPTHAALRDQRSRDIYEQLLIRHLLKNATLANTSSSPHVLRCLILNETRNIHATPERSPVHEISRNNLMQKLTQRGYSPRPFCYNIPSDDEKSSGNLEAHMLHLQRRKNHSARQLKKLRSARQQEKDRQAQGGLMMEIIEQHLENVALETALDILKRKQRRQKILRSPEYRALEAELKVLEKDHDLLYQDFNKKMGVIKQFHKKILALQKKPVTAEIGTQTESL